MQPNKYDGINFSPITEEMSKPQSARTNQLPNNSCVVTDFDCEPLKKQIYEYQENHDLKDKDQQINKSLDDCFTANRRIKDFMIAKTAEIQSPIFSKFKEGLNNLLEVEMTESDFKYSNKMVLNNLQTVKQSKSHSQSQTPVKNSIQASYNQPPINFKSSKNKKKKFRLFIQDQPFKVDGNSKSQAYQEYDPLQDKFLKDFFNGNKLKNFKKMQKNKNHLKKSEKSIKYSDQNKSQEIKCSSSQLAQNNNNLKSEPQENNEDKKFIVSKYLTEMSDDQKDNKKKISQFYGSSYSNQNNNLNSLTELSLDKIQISTKKIQFNNKENYIVGKSNENNRYNPNNINQYKNKKIELKQNCNNRASETSLDKKDDLNWLDVQQCKSPLSIKHGMQNILQISQHGLQFNNSKQNYLPKIQNSQKSEQPIFNEILNGQRSKSSNQNQPKAYQYASSQDYDLNDTTSNKINIQIKQKLYSIYQTQLNSNSKENQKNQITSTKPYYTFNGIQVQIPKPSKIPTNKIEQKNQLPNLINQNTYKKLNLSLNLASSSNHYQKINNSFQENQQDQQLHIQHSFDKIQPFISSTENKQNSNENYKFRSTLTKDQFNIFLCTFKQKYSPSNKNEFETNKIFQKQLSSQQYESKLLKEYKESISNDETI